MISQPSYWKVLTRRKFLAAEGSDYDTKLNRVLGLLDLTALGIGSTLGAGVYVLAGQIARDQAGPSVMLSFAIAALASLLAGICYAEFGARVPKAGSAYIYSYVCIGEFAAFVIGWNLILEYVLGTAAVCRGISLYLDTLINDTLKTTFATVSPMNVSFLGSYFDFFAFGLVIVFGVALAFGVENSAMANNFVTGVNIFILSFVIVAGAIKADFSNWTIDVSDVHLNETITGAIDLGTGGYFPFGFEGTLKGAATCFFGFVGFDCIATTGEEVCNPRKNIPRSILLSLLVIFLCYFGVSTVLTLMVPYYLQDPNAPLPFAFKEVGWTFAMWIVSVGGLIGLLASLFGALFPLSRIMYSMAEDGLLFHFLGKVSSRYRVPVIGSIFAAVMTALIAGLFNLDQLVNLLAIGTLLAYSVVAISITLLRYMDNSEAVHENGNHTLSENSLLTSNGSRLTYKDVTSQLFNCRKLQTPTSLSTRIVGTLTTFFCFLCLAIGLIFMQAYDALIAKELWIMIPFIVLLILTALVLLSICLQPQELYSNSVFRVPFVPIVPAISIFINIYLMLQLDTMTWIRFGVWMIIGVPIYIVCWCIYDIKNPLKRNPRRLSFARDLFNTPVDHKVNGHLKESDSTVLTNGSNGTTISIRNEQSVKSLDEILDLDKMCGELIELKHANGNKFYIEDTRSSNSETSSQPPEAESYNATAEEKSVIAMLDNVLKAADDDNAVISDPITLANLSAYDRKVSVDSEMIPSFIESTTVAMVHSSSDSSEKCLEELTEEGENEEIVTINNDNSSSEKEFERYNEIRRVATVLVDDILFGEELWTAISKHLETQKITGNEDLLKSAKESNELNSTNTTQNNTFSLKDREESEKSIEVEDPRHSDVFKNKLSQIISNPPNTNSRMKNERTEPTLVEYNKEALYLQPTNATPSLKLSRSETDLRHLVLKAIEDIGTNLDTQTAPPSNEIPKPPKFDPILYKTVNSLATSTKMRPSLHLEQNNPLINSNFKKAELSTTQVSTAQVPTTQVLTTHVSTTEDALPFKAKLEALLKRGPTHVSQKHGEIIRRRPKSVSSLEYGTTLEKSQEKTITKNYDNQEEIRRKIRQTISSNSRQEADDTSMR